MIKVNLIASAVSLPSILWCSSFIIVFVI